MGNIFSLYILDFTKQSDIIILSLRKNLIKVEKVLQTGKTLLLPSLCSDCFSRKRNFYNGREGFASRHDAASVGKDNDNEH